MSAALMASGSTRLHVDRTACVAHGVCADWLPEAVTLDECSYPVLTGTVSPDLVADAERAAAECPVRALLLLRTGSVGARTRPRGVGRPR